MPPQTELAELKGQLNTELDRLPALERLAAMTALDKNMRNALDEDALTVILRQWLEVFTFRSMI